MIPLKTKKSYRILVSLFMFEGVFTLIKQYNRQQAIKTKFKQKYLEN